MVLFLLLFDLFLHLLFLLPLYIHKIFLNLHDYLLPEFLFLQNCLFFYYGRAFVMIGCLDLIHGKLKVQIREFHLWISWLRLLEDEDEETTRAKDESIKMEDLFPFVGDSLTVDKSIVGRIFFKDFDVTLLRLRIIRDKGMIRLYPQRGQNNIRFGVAFFIADMQLFAGILDSEAELLVL